MFQLMADLSSNNHPTDEPIDGKALFDAGFRFAMVKATEGTTYVNPWLVKDTEACIAAGIKVGYYHFAHPGQSTPERQAEYFTTAIRGLKCYIGVALDLEVIEDASPRELAQWANAFCHHAQISGHGARIYTNPAFLVQMAHFLDPWPLWIASWGKRPRRQFWAWQFGTIDVPGIGPVDASHYTGK